MKLYMRQDYRASRKEPFGAMLRRIYEGLGQGGVPVQYRFTFADHMVQGMVSSVARGEEIPAPGAVGYHGTSSADFEGQRDGPDGPSEHFLGLDQQDLVGERDMKETAGRVARR